MSSRTLSAVFAMLAAVPTFAEPTPDVLPDTVTLAGQVDFAAEMVAGINLRLDRQLEESSQHRPTFWNPDFSSTEAYNRSIEPNRARFARIVGAVDPRRPAEMQLVADTRLPALVAETESYTVRAVRWPVLEGVDAEGLLLEPKRVPVACIVALPDADQPPEVCAGLASGPARQAQFARRLAENGCRVLVPALIDRACTWSGNPRIRMTNQPHREWIYRMAFEVGRHIIGYEVQKVLAAVDWFDAGRANGPEVPLPTGVMGYGEGGLIAFYAAALDPRIDAVVVSGYFQAREEIWKEPIYRNVWGLLREFGDAEIAALIAPRPLVVEAGRGPEIDGPPKLEGHHEAASGRLTTPPIDSVRREFVRARETYRKLQAGDRIRLVEAGDLPGPGTDRALAALLEALGVADPLKPSGAPAEDRRGLYDDKLRLKRQFDQLVEFTQKLLREAHLRRREFWAKADASSPEKWAESCRWYRDCFNREVIGQCERASLPANPRSRRIMDEPKFTGYEVMLDVWPDVVAYGVLLLPKDIAPGERRPVVVCQHGLEGRPDPIVNPRIESVYNSFGARLADRGFVVFAPQNPFIGGERFRVLQRKANPLKKSLFSVIVRQHERILEWLSDQPFVDPLRIGLYGLSYGGKTAMRVPALLPQYALSICSGDFNEWLLKNASVDYPFGYMFVHEYEMPEFDLGNTFDYAEMAALIAPRPFMVERGHHDPVAQDEWVGYEYAKVRRLYADLGIPDLTRIEWFPGRHEIHAVGTFEFLHKCLDWPE